MSVEAIQVRDPEPEEIGAIALVVVRANAERDGQALPNCVGDDELTDLQERMNRPNAWTYVVADGDEIIGFALGYPRVLDAASPDTTDTEYLSMLMVEPRSWGRGIASMLLNTITDQARSAGRSRLTLRTRDNDNEHARGVYEHKGFVLSGLTKQSRHGDQVEYELDLSR